MKALLLILLTLKEMIRIFCQREFPIILSLIKNLEIRQCFFVYEDESNLNSLAGKKILKNIPTAYITYEKLFNYLIETECCQIGTCMILKEKNIDRIEEISQNLDAVEQTYKMSKYTWLVFVENSELKLDSDKPKVPYDCEFIIIQPEANLSHKLIEYYSIKNKSFIYDFGVWNYRYGLATTNISLYWRRLDLNHSIIVSLVFPEKYIKRCETFPHIDYCQKLILIEEFSYLMNFNNLLIPFETTSIKKKYQVDIYNCPIERNSEVHNYYIVGPIFKMTHNWYIKHPSSTLRSDYFTRPFHKHLWTAIFFSILVGSMFVIIFNKLNKEKESSVIDTTFLIFESFCNQSSNYNIKNVYLKTICFLSQMMAIIITGSFGAVIAAFVAVETFQIPFTNIKDFVENGQYKLLLQHNDFLDAFLNESEDPTLSTIYKEYVYSLKDEEDMFKLLCTNPRLAFADEGYFLESFVRSRKPFLDYECDIYRISHPINVFQGVLELEDFSPFKSAFNLNLLKFYESGIQKTMEQTVQNKSIIEEEMKNNFKPVELKQMTIVLSIPFIGVLVATFFVIMEVFFKIQNKLHSTNLFERRKVF